MNEKAPEEAERGSALRMSSPWTKVARRPGAERMCPSEYMGPLLNTEYWARCSMCPCMAMSGGRVHGRKYDTVQYGCWSTRDLRKEWRIPKYVLSN